MKGIEDTRQIERYIALDIHKEYVLAGGQNARQEWVLPPCQVRMAKFREWASTNLREGDAVVLETTTNVWDIYDVVAPLTTRTVVAHAGAVRQIAEARVKTDKEEVKRLIRLLIADIVPEVWIPPTEVRELRGMISYSNRLVKMGTMVRNRLQSLLHRHNILLPKGKLLVAVWQVLTKEETDVHASEEDLAYKMLVLAWDLDEDVRMEQQFAKYAWMKLGVETDITRFVRKNVPRRVAPREEVLARMEQLGLTC